MPISKKIRFEVFKRDSFTCQYCGMAAPDVILHVDHIDPKSKGGSDGILNLLTSCSSCNSGKGARPLTDMTVLQKRKSMLDSLQERREQIEMMLQWQRGLENLDDDTADQLAAFWTELTTCGLTDMGLHDLKAWVKKFKMQEIMEAMRISASYYLQYKEGKSAPIMLSVEKAFTSVPGICVNRRRAVDDPRMDAVQHVRAIAKKNTSYINEGELKNALLHAIDVGVEKRDLLYAAQSSQSWTRLKNAIVRLIDEAEKE